MLRCVCLWLVVCGLAAGQTFSPPTSLPGDMLVGPSAGNQRAAVAAQGSGGYLAVWEDDRSGLIETVAAPDGFNWNRDIYGMEAIFEAGFREFNRIRERRGIDSRMQLEGAQRAMRATA